MTFTGVIKYQTTGIVSSSGNGQDYVRLNAPQGIIELHPAFNTTKLIMPVNQSATVAVDTLSVGAGWEVTYQNVPITRVGLGQTFDPNTPPNFDVVVVSNGVTSAGISVPSGTIPVGWTVGATLNLGFKRV